MQQAATYFYLNAVFASAGSTAARGGVGPSSAGMVGISKWMGVGAVGVNDGSVYSVARGLYAEGMHFNGNSGATVAAEFQVGNYNGTTLPVAHAHDMASSRVNAVQIAPESGKGYLQGSTAPGSSILEPTQPCGAGIDISGGTANPITEPAAFAYQKFVTGIVIRNGALHRSTFGATTDVAIAASLALRHQINWGFTTRGTVGAFVRSEVTSASQVSGLKLKNLGAAFVGADYERIICDFRDDTAADRATSSIIGNGTTATVITTTAHGLTNGDVVFLNDCVPNTFVGRHTVTVVDTTTFTFSSSVNATATTQGVVVRTAPRNYLQVRNARTAIAPSFHALGDDTNIDINLITKGTGRVSYGTWVSGADAAVNGYIEIRDAAGNVRRLATIA
jgi:hypothetical protein